MNTSRSAADDLIARVRQCGAQLTLKDGRLVLTPPGRCEPDLMAALREHRQAITEALQSGATCSELASLSTPLNPLPPSLPGEEAGWLLRWASQQGEAEKAWINERAALYRRAFKSSWGKPRLAAVVDLACWRFRGRIQSADRSGQIQELIAFLKEDSDHE